jgi:hypothetical protein
LTPSRREKLLFDDVLGEGAQRTRPLRRPPRKRGVGVYPDDLLADVLKNPEALVRDRQDGDAADSPALVKVSRLP